MAVTKIEEVDAAIELAITTLKTTVDDYKKTVDALLAKPDVAEEVKKLIAESNSKTDEEVKKVFTEIEKLKVAKNANPNLKSKGLL